MSFTPDSIKTMLNSIAPDTMKLHTGYPGTTGANEVTGGSPAYAAKTCGYGLSLAGEARALSAAVVFDVPACSVLWASCWQGSTLRYIGPTGGSPFEFVADTATNAIKAPAHGLADNETVVFYYSPPGGVTAGTVYYVVSSTTDDFKISATLGGSEVNITTQADASCLCSRIVPRVYAAQDTHTVSAFPFGLPN
jgi:hypothetical protein